MKNIAFAILLVLTFAFAMTVEQTLDEFSDTSDNNPIAFCLRLRNGFTDDEIAKFLQEIKDPSKAVALFPYGGKLSKCVQERRKQMAKKDE